MQYLFCSLGSSAIAFSLDMVDLLHAADEVQQTVSTELYQHFNLSAATASVVVSPKGNKVAWQVDRPICLCEVPTERIRSIPKLILPRQPWTTAVIAAGKNLYHQLQPFPLAWIVDPAH